MSGLAQPSALSNVWPRDPSSTATGLSSSGPVPLGGGQTSLPTVNNSNLPSYTNPGLGNLPPPVPQTPRTPFPTLQQPAGGTNSLLSNNYATANTVPSVNQIAANIAQNQMQNAQQNQIYQRRLTQLEDENSIRRNATANITQMGTQILQGQMDVQEQVLQYQLMLEQCMETLDHQNFALNEQAEEVALLRAKMRHFEYLMDAIKHSKEGSVLLRNMSGDAQFIDSSLLCCRDPLTLPAPSTSPFSAGGPTRVTASTFQPFNPRYRSPNSRATAAANLNERRATTPAGNNRNPPAAAAANTTTTNSNIARLSRRFGNAN